MRNKISTKYVFAALIICLLSPLTLCEVNDTFSHRFIHDYNGADSCSVCHRQVSDNVAESVHNTWMINGTGKLVGMNDFCGAVSSNEMLCGKCHLGFGLPTNDFTPEQVDCLICHAPDYKKTAVGPDPSVDVDAAIAGIIREPMRGNCLRCHAMAGGGNNRKRGDLELAMGAETVSIDLDVHMSTGMQCQDCHTFIDHHVSGKGMDLRTADTSKIVSCDDPYCHSAKPHSNNSLYDMHTERLSCTACHITSYGKIEPVETARNWEKELHPGMLTKESNPAPIHVWWNRQSEISDLGDLVELVNGVANLAHPIGNVSDPDSKIYAARLHKSRQPWDGNVLLPFKVGVVKSSGMQQAIFDATGKTYDPVQYVNTSRYMGIFHGVSPAEDALTCNDCHDDQKLDFEALGYDVEKDYTGKVIVATKPGSTVNFAKLSGKDCVSCHKIGGMLPECLQVDVDAMNDSDNIHYDLNRGAADTLAINNARCWACHGEGDGSEAAQPKGHSENFNDPKSCDDGDCHVLNQSVFMEPMVYAHFMDADNLIDESNIYPTANISTTATCDSCHSNSVAGGTSVSHYGSTRDLMSYPDFVTADCLYCHEEHYKGSPLADIADDWGGATDMMDDEADMIEDDLDRTMHAGDAWELRNGYLFEVISVDLNGNNARIRLSRDGNVVDEQIINTDAPYEYDHDITVEGCTFEQVDVRLNLTGVMRHSDGVVAVFEGRSIKRIHSETTNEACYACHVKGYGKNARYTIEDRLGDKTYYTEMIMDFSYYDDNESKTLSAGEVWDLGDNFSLTATQVDVDGDLTRLVLERNGEVMEDDVVHTGDVFYYEDDIEAEDQLFEDLRVFTVNITGIFRSHNEEIAVLDDARLISPDISMIDVEDTDGHDEFRLDGYNVSEFKVGDDFGGGDPLTLHDASLTNGWDIDFGKCTQCHDRDSGMNIKRVNGLEAHADLNRGPGDPVDQACWACHGTGDKPEVHPGKIVKDCKDCHAGGALFEAPDLSMELHSQIDDCAQCHARDYPDVHPIGTFSPDTPTIMKIDMASTVESGQLVHVSATAIAGWNMKVEAIEYSVDEQDPVSIDGLSGKQTEDFEFSVNTTGLDLGKHQIAMKAMERGKWGPISKISFMIVIPEPEVVHIPEKQNELPITSGLILIALAHGIGLAYIIMRRMRKQ